MPIKVLKRVESFTKNFASKIKKKKARIHLISHYDTDGITSAAIISKTLDKLGKQFSMKIIKQLNDEEIKAFPKDKTLILLDLGSGSIKKLRKLKNQIFIIDHHEVRERYKNKKNMPKKIKILNPHLFKEYEELCTAELSYLVSKEALKPKEHRILNLIRHKHSEIPEEFFEETKNLAHLSIIGMIGDTLEKNISRIRDLIIKDSGVNPKKGILLYPSTRPLDKTIEFSSKPFIPGATGNHFGAIELLGQAGIPKIGKTYKALIDLDKEEMKRLATTVFLRLSSEEKAREYLGNLYLIKFFNKIEDARELSAIINACSRMGHPEISLAMCMGNTDARKKAEKIYVKYRQHIIAGLRFIDRNRKIHGREYVIINTKDNVKDTIIGTLASILSFSSVYREGTIIIGMAYNKDKIKISARVAGRRPKSNRNLKEILDFITQTIGGEAGGHQNAAGCTIKKDKEKEFIHLIRRKLDFELVKI